MTITQRMMDNKLILTLSGRFDYQARKPFQEAILQAKAPNLLFIILNFAQVPSIDSSALGLLVLTHKNLQLTHQHLMLVAPQEYVLNLLKAANLHKMIPIGTTEQEAGKNLAWV